MEEAYAGQGGRAGPLQPLREYPRPQLVRDSYLNLNGNWEYAVTGSGLPPDEWDGAIQVPFGPQSPPSGAGRAPQPGEYLWYRRRFQMVHGFVRDRVLLHFGAVGRRCAVYLNGWEVERDRDGLLPFTLDITAFCLGGEQELTLRVPGGGRDGPAGGRQEPCGIWQTVWVESVPTAHITGLRVTPLAGEGAVEVTVLAEPEGLAGEIEICAGDRQVAAGPFTAGQARRFILPQPMPWSPESPFLYSLVATTGDDRVDSYFGLRSLAVAANGGRGALTLNGSPFFGAGILDGGWLGEPLCTPPTEQAMLDGLLFAKACGFNTIYQPGGPAPLRWYYHCDRLGLVVWQGLPAAGGEEAPGEEGAAPARGARLEQTERAVTLLYNSPSLGAWMLCPPDADGGSPADTAEEVRRMDPTRLVGLDGDAPGRPGGDIFCLRAPGGTANLPADTGGRAAVITRCGNFAYAMEDGATGDGLPPARLAAAREALAADIAALYRDRLMPLAQNGLYGFFFGQLADTGSEATGLLAADRCEQKIHPRGMATLNAILTRAALAPGGEADSGDSAAGEEAGP